MQGKRGEGEGKKKAQYWHHKQHVSLLTLQSGTHTHTHAYTHTLLLHPTSPCNLQPKSRRERFSTHTHTTNWHLISQPKGWLAQRWLRLCLCPTQRTTLSSRWPWASSSLLSFFFYPPLSLSLLLFISSFPPFLCLHILPPSPPHLLSLFCLFSLSLSTLYCTTLHCPCPST